MKELLTSIDKVCIGMPMYNKDIEQRISDYMNVGEAARYLGVSAPTLRNWDHSGKFPATRHPINNYRLYRVSDLENLLVMLRRRTLRVKKKGNQ